ncbi:hypothetical protein GALMADRAFT_814719 [Galerina marginata CBS 339.88]|uniref:Uncharacterized protein n=1 Tax=Galerina marginata (strain CBS 339.88) TaxID=685588 RepID=A0A067SJB5_GALM3|nr:hypothetical protein GALMADRAFT_814719 [Galerina marginata CBS 339.88]
MGRFADPYGDDNRLPAGMVWTGYDADTGERFYADRDGSTWVGAPWAEYGILKRLKGPPLRNGPSTTRAKKRQQYVNDLGTALCPAEPMPQGSSDLDGSDLARTEKKRPPQRSQSVPVPVPKGGSIRREEHRGSEPGERGRTKSKKHGTRPPVDAEEGLSSSSKDKKDSDIRSRESDQISQEPVHRSIRRSKIGTRDDASEPAGADGADPESVPPSASTSTKRTSGGHRRSASTKEITRAHTLAARPLAAGQWNSETERPKTSRPHSPRTSRGKSSESEKDTRTKSSSKSSVDTDSADGKARRLESALHPTRETKPLPKTPPVSGHHCENSTEEKSSPEDIPAVADSPARIPAKKSRPILRQITRLVRAAMSKF